MIRIFLTGYMGAGKTTLIKILTGLYTDYEGTVLVNDIDLRKIDMKDYQNKISTVFQDYNNYEFDAKNNIGVGDITQINNKEKIIKAAKLTGADDIIQTLPNKYDQQLGNWFSGGIQLSGGQWQKIAIARSLIRCASMYILDEPTAALDPSAEYSFFKNFRNNILDKIGIFVTHRFSNVKIADNIFVLKDGKLIEKRELKLPKKIVNVLHCKNPRCITSIEQELEHVFVLTDKENGIYSCQYCEEKQGKLWEKL